MRRLRCCGQSSHCALGCFAARAAGSGWLGRRGQGSGSWLSWRGPWCAEVSHVAAPFWHGVGRPCFPGCLITAALCNSSFVDAGAGGVDVSVSDEGRGALGVCFGRNSYGWCLPRNCWIIAKSICTPFPGHWTWGFRSDCSVILVRSAVYTCLWLLCAAKTEKVVV